jgi:phage terminase large subunit
VKRAQHKIGRPISTAPTRADLWRETMERVGNEDQDFRPYAHDPAAFCSEVLGVSLWAKQREACAALAQEKQLTIRSSHGVGKTFLASAIVLWWTYCLKPSLVLTTAPTARQVEEQLWAEINRRWANAAVPLPGRCLLTHLDASMTQRAVGLSTNEPDKFAGWHEENLLVIVDEASGVPDKLYSVIQGTLTSANCKLLLIGNPTRADGYFANSHRQWRASQKKHISSFDCPNLAPGADPEHPPLPRLVTRSWVEARRGEWGEDSDAWRVRVLGEFPKLGDNTLVALEWIEAAESALPGSNPSAQAPAETIIGLDVARFGTAETVAAVRQGDTLLRVEAWHGMDTVQSAGRALGIARETGASTIVVDAVGVGGGVADQLQQAIREDASLWALTVVEFESSARSTEPDRFHSARDEAYWLLRERYRTQTITHAQDWSPLTGQLTGIRYGTDTKGRIQVESKKEMLKRGVPSPDWADAVAMAFTDAQAGYNLPATDGQSGVRSA